MDSCKLLTSIGVGGRGKLDTSRIAGVADLIVNSAEVQNVLITHPRSSIYIGSTNVPIVSLLDRTWENLLKLSFSREGACMLTGDRTLRLCHPPTAATARAAPSRSSPATCPS
jgi:hypothetical protein